MVRVLKTRFETLLSESLISLFNGSRCIQFGRDNNTDLVTVRRVASCQSPRIFYGTQEFKISRAEALRLSDGIDELLRVDASASFSISSGLMQSLKKSIQTVNASHVRFFSQGEKLRIVVFDYVKFHSSYRLPRKTSNLVRYHDTLVLAHEDFSATVFASSLSRLPAEGYLVRVGSNGVTQFTNDRDETKFLLRDQGLREPLAVFHSPQVGQNICFALHPN